MLLTEKKRLTQWVLLPLLILCLWAGQAAPAAAAPFVFSTTVQKAFDKLVQESSSARGADLKKKYEELQTLQRDEIDKDTITSKLKFSNQERDKALRKAIREIDSAKIAALQADVANTKKKYEPLFTLYDGRKAQLKLAKSTKNKSLISYYQLQTDLTKTAVQVAKQDISGKEKELKTAKTDASAKMKAMRDLLFQCQSFSTKIKTARSEASNTKKLLNAELKTLNQAVRNGDATAVLSSLNKAITHQKQINARKTSMHSHEASIATILTLAETRLKNI